MNKFNMNDLSFNVNGSDLSSPTLINEQFRLNNSNSSNDILTHSDDSFFSPQVKLFLLLGLAIIVGLVCLTICIIVLCICLKRRRKSKDQENEDQLLPEQSNKSSKIPVNNPTTINGKQGSSLQPTNSNAKVPIKSFYYDTLDDIPFIDESRPTSVVDMTQV